jgi:hypothetical protein
MSVKQNDRLREIQIYREFRQGILYEDLYKKYEITKSDLTSLLKRMIKGNYDYNRILSGGLKSQNQFIKHLNNRWNPFEPDLPWEAIPPYLEGIKSKKEIIEDE